MVGFVVPPKPLGPGGSELREYLRKRLPGYIVPAAITMKADSSANKSICGK
jgi:hypothetical protein